MSEKPETLFKKKVQKDLEAMRKRHDGAWWVKTQQVCIVGTPDILLCIAGKFVAIELKATAAGKPSRLQWENLDRINRADGLGLLVHPGNWPEIRYMLEMMLRGIHTPDSILAAARASIGINHGKRSVELYHPSG